MYNYIYTCMYVPYMYIKERNHFLEERVNIYLLKRVPEREHSFSKVSAAGRDAPRSLLSSARSETKESPQSALTGDRHGQSREQNLKSEHALLKH